MVLAQCLRHLLNSLLSWKERSFEERSVVLEIEETMGKNVLNISSHAIHVFTVPPRIVQ
jgi:hypothetical protein